MKHPFNKNKLPEIIISGDKEKITKEQWLKVQDASKVLEDAGFFVGITNFYISIPRDQPNDWYLEGLYYPNSNS